MDTRRETPESAAREVQSSGRAVSSSSSTSRVTEEDLRIAEALAASRAAAARRAGAEATPPRSAAAAPPPATPAAEREAPAAPAPKPAAAPRPRTHVVARGDTFYGIASEYSVAPSVLADANPGVDPERIRIGQTLRVPALGGEVTTRTHQVGRGDTLWGIARRYNVTPDEIRAFNRMEDERVQVGQVLRIPPP